MRLYYNPMSSNARRAVMTTLELGIDVELVLVELQKGQQRTPEFLKLNPNGRVPVLVDDGLVLSESHAIMQYLADKTPGGEALYPKALAARADVNRWMFWNAHHFAPAVSILNWERVVKPFIGQGAPDPAQEARGEELVTQLGKVLDAHLAERTWLAQDRLTLADLSVATPLMSTRPARLPVGDFKHLNAWLERIQARESWKKTSL